MNLNTTSINAPLSPLRFKRCGECGCAEHKGANGSGHATYCSHYDHRTAAVEKPFDQVGAIIAYESGELDHEETIKLFQHLVNTGLAWSLQGHYGRTAAALIEAGEITTV